MTTASTSRNADGILLDARLGNCPRWYLGPVPHLKMRIPPEIINSVVFVGYRYDDADGEKLKLCGTGVVVSVQETPQAAYHYLVTDKHVLSDIEGKSQVIRANSATGGAALISYSGNWWTHPAGEFVDVAVCPFDARGIDVAPFPAQSFLTDQTIYDFYVGPGDEVSIIGLFTKLTGESKNIPVVRRGTVAMLPDQKIPSVKMGNCVDDMDGYLIEVRSVGGLSGSPAYVRAPVGVDYSVHNRSNVFRKAKVHFQGDYFLLGLCQSHWEIPAGERNRIDLPSATKDGQKKPDAINLGIAIVTPAKKILEVLNHPELVAMRKSTEQARIADQGTTTQD